MSSQELLDCIGILFLLSSVMVGGKLAHSILPPNRQEAPFKSVIVLFIFTFVGMILMLLISGY